jgi:hypothetical protein
MPDGPSPRCALFRLADVSGGVLVDRLDAGDVPRLVGGEGHGEVVALPQSGQAGEVGAARFSAR